jgi:hypothetical protein
MYARKPQTLEKFSRFVEDVSISIDDNSCVGRYVHVFQKDALCHARTVVASCRHRASPQWPMEPLITCTINTLNILMYCYRENNQLDASISKIYFCHKPLHLSGNCFAHRSRDSVVSITTRYGVEGPGIESRWGEFFRTYSDRLRGPPSLLYNGYLVFPRGRGGRGVMLTTHPLLVPRLRKS